MESFTLFSDIGSEWSTMTYQVLGAFEETERKRDTHLNSYLWKSMFSLIISVPKGKFTWQAYFLELQSLK